MRLFEKWNPKTWDEVIGQHKAIRQLELLRPSGLGGRAYWLSAPSGTGKTSMAALLAEEVADDWSTFPVDAAKLTRTDVEEYERKSSVRPLGKGGWAFLVNEAHQLPKQTMGQLLNTLDTNRVPKYVVWVFTTTNEGEACLFEERIDAPPLISRCTELKMARRSELEAPFAAHCQRIAKVEGLDGKSYQEYVCLVKRLKHNLRECLQHIEAGEMLF